LKLSLHIVSEPLAANGYTYRYAVGGLPDGQETLIANQGSRNRPDWKLLRTIESVHGNWSGKYATPVHALAALQREVELESTLD
jgi:hypothetical protein